MDANIKYSVLLFSGEYCFLVNPKGSMCSPSCSAERKQRRSRVIFMIGKKISFSLFSFAGALWSDNMEFPLKLEQGEGN